MQNRIGIVGTSGAGKTTLGIELARRTGGVFVEVDAILHKPNWVRATDAELRNGIDRKIAGHDRWIIDSLCESQLGDYISSQLDLIVWLDLPLPLKMIRMLRRSWKRWRTNELLWGTNYESLHSVFFEKDSLIAWAIKKHFEHRKQYPLKPYASRIVRLRSRREVAMWLESFAMEM